MKVELKVGSHFSTVFGPEGDGFVGLQFFADDGSNNPNYSNQNAPTSYVRDGVLYLAWEEYNATRDRRAQWGRSIDLVTGFASPKYFLAINPLSEDDHGNPTINPGPDNHIYCIHGCHATAGKVVSSMDSNDPVPTIERANIGTDITYPHQFTIGSDLWLVTRHTTSDSPPQQHPLAYYKGPCAAGVWTPGAKITIVDFGSDTRVYAGGGIAIGTDIYITAAWSNGAATDRRHLYLFVIDTLTGDVSNLDGTVTTLAALLPINLNLANTSYRLADTGTGQNSANSSAIIQDAAGDLHIIYRDGADGSAGRLRHLLWNGAALSAPFEVGVLEDEFGPATIGLDASGGVQVIWSRDPDDEWIQSGTIYRRARSSAGVWSPTELLRETSLRGFAGTNPVQNGTSLARASYFEISPGATFGSPLDPIAGGLKGYVIGDEGAPLPIILNSHEIADADAAAYVARLSSLPSSGKRWLIDKVLSKIKAKIGWATKFDGLYFPGFADTEADALLNVRQDAYNLSVVGSPIIVPGSHIGGGAAAGYFETGFNISSSVRVMAQNSVHIGGRSLVAAGDNNSIITAGANLATRASDGTNMPMRLNTGTGQSFGAQTNKSISFIGNRSASNVSNGYKDGLQNGSTNAGASSAPTNATVQVFGNLSVASSNQNLGYVTYGASLTAAEILAFHQITLWMLRHLDTI